jgi:hypothetical protein
VPRKDTNRDELDRAIQGMLRDARIPRGVPSPAPGEPDDDDVLRYVEGLLPPADKKRFEEAMARHPFTQSRVEALQGGLSESGEGPNLVERAARYVFAVGQGALEFLRGATDPLHVPSVAWATRSATPAPAHAASHDSFYEFLHAFGALRAHVKIEHVASSRLDVQLSLEEKSQPVTDARISVIRSGQVVDSMPVEESGSATLSSLEPDRYELEIRRAGKIVGTLKLDFLN